MTNKLRIDNPDFIPLVLFRKGGVGQFVDVEDIFVGCHEIAPERFGWRKYDFPNYKILSKALRDFEEKHPDLLIMTPDGLVRQLSAEGVEWLRTRLPRYEKVVEGTERSPATRRPGQRILNEISAHPLAREFSSGLSPNLVKHEVADLLLCSPDSPPAIWSERLETYRSAASESNRPDLLRFLDYVKSEKPEWFGGDR
jgi:hypothetical protein